LCEFFEFSIARSDRRAGDTKKSARRNFSKHFIYYDLFILLSLIILKLKTKENLLNKINNVLSLTKRRMNKNSLNFYSFFVNFVSKFSKVILQNFLREILTNL